MVNAFAMPDAYIFVTRGILAHFNSEDELAGVLGHEIGHVVGSHSKRRIRGARLSELLGWIGSYATGSSAAYGLSQAVASTTLAGYGRAYELEADEYGSEFVIKAGYNPRALLDSIQTLRDNDDFERSIKNRPPVYHGITGSHPAHAKRLNELVNQSQHLFPDQLQDTERDFHAMLNGLRFGDDATSGVVKEGVYFHGGLRLAIAFPKDWDISAGTSAVTGNSPAGVPKAKIAIKRQSPPDEEQSPLEYLTKTLRRDDLEDGKEIQVGVYPGYLAKIKVAGPNADPRMIAVIYKDGGVFLFEGEIAKEGDAAAFAEEFESTIQSFRAMTAADLRLVNSQKIKIIEARPGMTYAGLAKTVPVKRYAEATLRLINGHHPRGEPRAGDLIKTVE